MWLSGIQASYPSLYNNSFSALPYILTLIVLAGVVGRSVPRPRSASRTSRKARTERRGRPRSGRIAFLDLDEGRGPVPTADDVAIAEVLHTSRRIAVIGASSRPGRPSYGVFRYLLDHGYDCVPVNPNETARPRHPGLPHARGGRGRHGPFDIVDVFRRSELVSCRTRDEAVAIGARCFWLQLGHRELGGGHDRRRGRAVVVMDRCTAIELRRFGGPTSAR